MEPVKLDDLAAALSRRGAPLTPESATFIVHECVDALKSSARVLSPEGVLIGADGVVSVVEEVLSPAIDESEVLRGAVEMLEGLLLAPSAGVLDLAQRVREGEVRSRAALLAELSALLVPFNRGAARRMLGRLVREHGREHPEVSLPPESSDAPEDPGGAADATWIDRPGGPLAHLDGAGDTQPEGAVASPKRGGQLQGLAMLALSLAALGLAAWFLWSRL